MKICGQASGARSGATLVEVVVTVGILITTLVPLIGLLSAAIDASGRAANSTIGARIAAGLISEVQQSDWAALQAWSAREIYFDAQGQELFEATAPQEAAYIARVKMGSAAGVVMGTGTALNDSLRQVVVMVTGQPAPRGRLALDEAEAAMAMGKELPKRVSLSRAMLVNLEKPPGV